MRSSEFLIYAKRGRLISRLTSATANPLNRLGTVRVAESLVFATTAAASWASSPFALEMVVSVLVEVRRRRKPRSICKMIEGSPELLRSVIVIVGHILENCFNKMILVTRLLPLVPVTATG